MTIQEVKNCLKSNLRFRKEYLKRILQAYQWTPRGYDEKFSVDGTRVGVRSVDRIVLRFNFV